MNNDKNLLTILLVLVLFSGPAYASPYRGRIVEADTKKPIEGAFVTLDDTVVQTDARGMFQISGEGNHIGVRAYGHVREWIDISRLKDETQEVALIPFTPKTSG